jgi:LuxR family maltose regulon positive regulatory protein
LTDTLEAGRSSIVVVVAPAGFGKTTAVADWLDATGHPFRWLSLEQHDNDLVAFFTVLAAALEPLPGGHRLRGMVSSSSGLAATDVALAAAAVEDLGAAPDGLVVVLDDLHLIAAEDVHRAVQFIVDHVPDNVTLVLVSRADPPVALARLRVAGRLTELRAADLAFDQTESEELLTAAGQTISGELVSRLNERIEGWAVGLRLAALSLAGRSDVEEFVDSFSGDDRYVADYLLEEVLGREPERVQRFLLETSLLEELIPEMCDAVLGTSQSADMLDDLFTRNLFLTRPGSDSDRYRYHQLFAELLRARIHGREAERAAEVLRSAAAWCQRSGDLDRALRYLIRAGELDDAASLVARRAPRLLTQGDIGRHQAWLRLFAPEVVRREPGLLLTRAWSELFAERPQEALRSLARVEHIAPDGFTASRAGQFELMRAIAAWFDGRHLECIEHGHRSLELLAERDLGSRCVSHLYCGVGELVVGESSEALHQLELARSGAEQTGSDYTAFSARVATGALHVRDGQLEPARFVFQLAVDQVRDLEAAGQHFPIGGAAHLGCGIVAFERLELDAATDSFRRTLVDLRMTTAVDYTALTYRRWAEAQSLLGNDREASEIIDEARDHLASFGETRAMVHGLDDCAARAALRAGDLERAQQLHERSVSTPQRGQREFDSPRFEQLATAVRLALARNRPQTAKDEMVHLSRLAGTRVGPCLEAATLEAAVHLALGSDVEAARAVEKAVALATAGGWLRLLVDVDPAVTGLLRACSTADDETDRLVERAVAGGTAARRPSDRPQPLIAPLTGRELEVLAEVAAGLTNAEIASRLFISVGTTKRHIANIFMKLPAKHRAEAVARARALGIIG